MIVIEVYFEKNTTIRQILKENFLEPYQLSAYKIAKDINVPSLKVMDNLENRCRITTKTGSKLTKYSGISERFFVSLQSDIDIRKEKEILSPELEDIKPIEKDLLFNQNIS